MSSSRNDDIPTSTIIDLIKANARALYGRHLTYDVITTAPKPPKQWHPAAKHDGQKAHALLVGYDSESPSSGIVLQGAFSVGVSRTPPTVGFALRILYDELTVNLEGFVERLVKERKFEGGLLDERADVEVDDNIDGITLRGE